MKDIVLDKFIKRCESDIEGPQLACRNGPQGGNATNPLSRTEQSDAWRNFFKLTQHPILLSNGVQGILRSWALPVRLVSGTLAATMSRAILGLAVIPRHVCEQS